MHQVYVHDFEQRDEVEGKTKAIYTFGGDHQPGMEGRRNTSAGQGMCTTDSISKEAENSHRVVQKCMGYRKRSKA